MFDCDVERVVRVCSTGAAARAARAVPRAAVRGHAAAVRHHPHGGGGASSQQLSQILCRYVSIIQGFSISIAM